MAVRVAIPTHLGSYTDGAREVSASGTTLAAVVDDLNARFPGLRFRIVDEQERIRPHIKLFIGQDLASDLRNEVRDGELVTIVAALSGG
jgi:molybdopterin converting factor small subunit